MTNNLFKLSGHHLHPPSAVNLSEVGKFDSVQIVDSFDSFCDETCNRGCEYKFTTYGQKMSKADRAIAEHYCFEIGRTYSIAEFMNLFSAITENRAMAGSRLNAEFFGVV